MTKEKMLENKREYISEMCKKIDLEAEIKKSKIFADVFGLKEGQEVYAYFSVTEKRNGLFMSSPQKHQGVIINKGGILKIKSIDLLPTTYVKYSLAGRGKTFIRDEFLISEIGMFIEK